MPAPDIDHTAIPYFRPGQQVSLIRWEQVAGEWQYTTVIGRYRRRDPKHWHVDANGEELTLDRNAWTCFS